MKHAPKSNGITEANGHRIVRKRVSSLQPSPENQSLYRPPDDDPDVGRLAASIQKNGCDPLVVTLDNYIVSGHRRHAALERIGQEFVRCQVIPRRRDSWSDDEYVALLRTFNHQRNKTVAEQVREELVDIDPKKAHRRLQERRDRAAIRPGRNGVHALEIEGTKRRYNISGVKADHVKYVLRVVEEMGKYWPLSIRGVHYKLLNFDFVRGYYHPKRNEPDYGRPRELHYVNDDNSYAATSDLITRLRLDGTIDWDAFDDFTRPITEFAAFTNVRHYVRQEVRKLFDGYWRDLLQSQPNHVEIICEKNTVYHMVLQVAEKYQIPTSSGRGFNSIDPWHDLYERFGASRKERLILIVLSDFDPEGQMIPHVAGRTLVDDFGVDEDDLTIIQAGVTRDQIDRYGLRPQNFAKETSSNHDWFVERNGGDDTVYELEALDPADMLRDLERVVRGVLDLELFEREVAQEEEEAAYLEAARERAREALKGLGEEEGEEE
jgi:hypothetical protein